ncbi:MAG TPA: PTS sugar transporter subunit IIB [Longimicrobiales bacterium]|nr:PTS sugar transporter subunit IIB [Longimicrobiales bacterium]
MGVVLFRVDERLIHGQVVVGWGGLLRPDRIIVVADDLAQSAWEQELYCIGLPDDVTAQFVTVDEARSLLAAWRTAAGNAFVLTRDVATMLRLAHGGLLRGAEINIGGIHYAAGRREVLPYVYLADSDEAALRELAAAGVAVSARDLPGTRRVDLAQLLRDGDAA